MKKALGRLTTQGVIWLSKRETRQTVSNSSNPRMLVLP